MILLRSIVLLFVESFLLISMRSRFLTGVSSAGTSRTCIVLDTALEPVCIQGWAKIISTCSHKVRKSFLLGIISVDLLMQLAIWADEQWSRLFMGPWIEAQHRVILLTLASVFNEHRWIEHERSTALVWLTASIDVTTHLKVVKISNYDIFVCFLNNSLLRLRYCLCLITSPLDHFDIFIVVFWLVPVSNSLFHLDVVWILA